MRGTKKRGSTECRDGQCNSEFSNCLSPIKRNIRPIISIPISNAKNEFVKALIDSGADICIIKDSICNENININNYDSIPLSSFTNNQVYTHGTNLAQITLNNKIVPQKFHVVPNTVRMHEFDAILGIDFLSENGIIIDYGRRIVYTNPDNIQIIHKPSVLPILKHSKSSEIKNKIENSHKSVISTCQNTENSYTKDENLIPPLLTAEKDVIYINKENLLNKFVENKFSEEILYELNGMVTKFY